MSEQSERLKELIREIHGSHYVGDAQHTKLAQIESLIDAHDAQIEIAYSGYHAAVATAAAIRKNEPNPAWLSQAIALERVAEILVQDVKRMSNSSLFRSGVDISASKLRAEAQLLRDFQETYELKQA